MIDWKRYEDELAAARSAGIAVEVVARAHRSRRRFRAVLLATGLSAIAVLAGCRFVQLARARRRVYQSHRTFLVLVSTRR